MPDHPAVLGVSRAAVNHSLLETVMVKGSSALAYLAVRPFTDAGLGRFAPRPQNEDTQLVKIYLSQDFPR